MENKTTEGFRGKTVKSCSDKEKTTCAEERCSTTATLVQDAGRVNAGRGEASETSALQASCFHARAHSPSSKPGQE